MLPRNNIRYFRWARSLMRLWVRTKIIPADPKSELKLSPGVPVLYVLPTRSVSDLLVLDEICRRHGLPRPEHKKGALKQPGAGSYLYLHKMGFLQVERDSKDVPSPLTKLVGEAESDKDMEVQIVPVSVFWGRNPGRDERSIMRLLFFDDEHAGIVQKTFIVAAQGRHNFVQFGKPISLRGLVDEGAGAQEAAKKLRRVLRVHFRRQRTAALGPSLPSRASVIGQLIQTRAMREAIQEEARKKRITVERAETRARRYLAEIASEQQYSVVRLADIFLTWLWNRIFNGVVIKHSHRLREIDKTAEVVYLPCHRSHMDYLLLSYSIFYEGFVPPHTAAGVNLNFWPMGPLLRRCGAFYIRRSFGGNRLYTVAFNEYVHFLLTKGHPVKFYVEGGRSRTGRLLPPKTGMLAMVVQSYFRNSDKPIVFVPVFLGYEKVMEVRTYQTELRGATKRKESMSQLVKARRALKSNFGRAYIGFGEPIYLEEFLNKRAPDWRAETSDLEQKPKWLHPLITELADDVLTRVNSTAVVSPLALFALVMLSTPNKAMAEEDLIYLMDKLEQAMRVAPYSPDVVLPEGSARDHVHQAMAVAKVERFQHPGGDVIFMDERESTLLTYYRNNILHLVAIPSLVASFFQHNERMNEEELVQSAARLYPFLKSEFFLRWGDADGEKVVHGVIQALIGQGLLFCEEDGVVRRPDVTSRDLTSLLVLSRALGPTLERYAVSSALLARHLGEGAIDRKEYESQCQLMAQRISILNGMNEPDAFDKSLFKNFLSLLEERGYLRLASEGRFEVDQRIRDIALGAVNLLSSDIRQSIQRITVGAKGPAVE